MDRGPRSRISVELTWSSVGIDAVVFPEGRAADAADGRAPAHAARGRALAKKKCERGDGAEDAGRSAGKVCLSRKRGEK